MSRSAARRYLARYGAPVAFLAAVTLAVVLVRSALDEDGRAEPAGKQTKPGALVSENAQATGRRSAKARYYVIRAGDTLEAVARRFDTTVRRLRGLNPGVEPTSLRIGQRIRAG